MLYTTIHIDASSTLLALGLFGHVAKAIPSYYAKGTTIPRVQTASTTASTIRNLKLDGRVRSTNPPSHPRHNTPYFQPQTSHTLLVQPGQQPPPKRLGTCTSSSTASGPYFDSRWPDRHEYSNFDSEEAASDSGTESPNSKPQEGCIGSSTNEVLKSPMEDEDGEDPHTHGWKLHISKWREHWYAGSAAEIE